MKTTNITPPVFVNPVPPASFPSSGEASLGQPARPSPLTPTVRRMALGAFAAVVLGILLILKGDVQFVMALCIAMTLGLGAYAWIAMRYREEWERRFVACWFSIAYGIKVLLAFVIFYFMRDRIAYDAPTYEMYGSLWAEFWRGNLHIAPVEYLPSLHNYSMMVAAQYYLTDTNYLAPCLTNCLLGALLVPILYQTARDHFDESSARNAAILAAVVASWITWSAIAMRDIVMIFFLTLALRELLALARRNTGAPMMRFVVWFAGVWLMRPYIGLMLILVTGTTLVFRLTRHPVLRLGVALGFIGILALIFFHGGTQALLLDVIQAQTEQINGARQAMVSISYGNDDRSWGLHENFQSFSDVAKFLPVAVFYLLAGPFIWQYGGMHIVLLIPELITWYALLFFGARGMWRLRGRGAQVPLLSFFLIGAVLYALISDAYAIAIRHRSQLDVPLILWASVGLPKRPPKFLSEKDPAT